VSFPTGVPLCLIKNGFGAYLSFIEYFWECSSEDISLYTSLQVTRYLHDFEMWSLEVAEFAAGLWNVEQITFQ